MSTWKAAVGVVAGALLIYAAAAPYITVHQIKDAARRQDVGDLSEHIDFPSVRQSFKDQVNAQFLKALAEDEEVQDSAFASIGMALVGAMVDKLVDAYVTPAGITLLMAGEKPQSGIDQDRINANKPAREPLSDARMSYESLSKFVIATTVERASLYFADGGLDGS
jgi:hypothetical protein